MIQRVWCTATPARSGSAMDVATHLAGVCVCVYSTSHKHFYCTHMGDNIKLKHHIFLLKQYLNCVFLFFYKCIYINFQTGNNFGLYHRKEFGFKFISCQTVQLKLHPWIYSSVYFRLCHSLLPACFSTAGQ